MRVASQPRVILRRRKPTKDPAELRLRRMNCPNGRELRLRRVNCPADVIDLAVKNCGKAA